MNDKGSTLVAHCGARKVTREQLKEIAVPEGTKTHQPLSHFEIVEVLEEALSFRYLKIRRDEYAVSPDGMKMFGVMDLDLDFDGGSYSIGLRNSNDKSMRLALTAGYRVFVCDNMAFSGDFTPLSHKHTRNLELRDSISIAVDRIHRGFGSMETNVRDMQGMMLTDNDVRLFIYRAFMERTIKGLPRNLMPLVHGHYFDPQHNAFQPRNMWSLSNAFTSAFKELAPMRQFEVTARLGSYLRQIQDDLNFRPQDVPNGLIADGVVNGLPFISEQPKQLSAVAGANGFIPSAPDWQGRELFDREDYGEVKGEYPFDDFSFPDDEAELDRLEHMADDLLEEDEQKLAA